MDKFDSSSFINHLKEKWKGKACPMCDTGNWNISDTVYEIRKFSGGGLVVGNVPIMPLIPVTCDNCGNTVLVNALLSGAIKQEKKESNNE